MENNSSLSKTTAWYTIGNLFIRLISFLLLPLYSNKISTTEFGNYSLIMSLYAILSVIYQSGLQSALSKYYIEENDVTEKKKIFSTILNSALLLGIILTTIIYLSAGWISRETIGSLNYTDLIRLVFTALLFESITSISLQLIITLEHARKLVVYSSLNAIINFALNIYLVYYLNKGIHGIIWAQLISSIILLLILLPFLKENYLPGFRSVITKNVLKFSYPLIIAGIFSACVSVIDRFIIDHFMGKSEVGIYSFSYRIALIMNVYVISLRNSWTPYSLKLYNKGDYTKEYGKSFTKIIAASFLIFLVVSMFIDDLYNFHIAGFSLINPKYSGGIEIIPVILFSYIFIIITNYYSVYPYVSGKSYHFLLSDLIALILNISLNFILIPEYGIMGAAIATFFSYLGGALYLFIISEKKIKISYEPMKLLLIFLITALLFTISRIFDILFVDIILFLSAISIMYFLTGIRLKNIYKV